MSGAKGEMEERKVGMRRRRERGRFGPERIHLMKRGEKQALLDRAHKGKVHRRQLGRNTSASGEEREKSRGRRQESRRYFISRHFLPHTLQRKKGREEREAAAVFNGLHSTKA